MQLVQGKMDGDRTRATGRKQFYGGLKERSLNNFSKRIVSFLVKKKKKKKKIIIKKNPKHYTPAASHRK